MSAEKELADYREALRKIARACNKPFGKDARQARKIARDTLAKWGYATSLAAGAMENPETWSRGRLQTA